MCCVFTGLRMPDRSCNTALSLAFTICRTPFSKGEHSCFYTFWDDLQPFFLGPALGNDENPAPLITQSNSVKPSP